MTAVDRTNDTQALGKLRPDIIEWRNERAEINPYRNLLWRRVQQVARIRRPGQWNCWNTSVPRSAFKRRT